MKTSTGNLTKAQQRRFDAMYALGCIACRMNGLRYQTVAEIHHYLRGNKRISHDATIPLCAWHHQGVSSECDNATMLGLLGPSFHKHTRQFRAMYGTDADLLAHVNELIGEPS